MNSPKLIRADLHSHTHFSKDGLTTPEEFVRRNVASGIDCIAVSDHNNIEGAKAVERIAPFRVIISEEIKSTEGEIIGYFLNDPVPRDLTPEDTVKAIKEQHGLVGVPHPFDRARSSPLKTTALMRILPDVQILETYNARNLLQVDNRRAATFAAQHGLIASAGTDAHWGPEVGHTWVVMPDFADRDDFLDALRAGRIHGHAASPIVHLMSTLAKIRWRLGISPVQREYKAAGKAL
ncbi:MAG TPA: PHP domain-containing protein [Dehalococcoidia bacterium]|nr:PHP domain-containing protein [Dehalococcoidia bacterium]